MVIDDERLRWQALLSYLIGSCIFKIELMNRFERTKSFGKCGPWRLRRLRKMPLAKELAGRFVLTS